jgi:hypothetical protein
MSALQFSFQHILTFLAKNLQQLKYELKMKLFQGRSRSWIENTLSIETDFLMPKFQWTLMSYVEDVIEIPIPSQKSKSEIRWRRNSKSILFFDNPSEVARGICKNLTNIIDNPNPIHIARFWPHKKWGLADVILGGPEKGEGW